MKATANGRAKRHRSRDGLSILSWMLLAGGFGAVVALAGMRLGDAYGNLVPLAAGLIGAGLAGGLAWSANRRIARARRSNSTEDDDTLGDRKMVLDASKQIAGSGLPQSPKEPEWPVETHEVQLKLDLAREYLAVDEADLATQLLQEVFELEVLVARKMTTELLRETRDVPPEADTAEQDRPLQE